MRINRRTITVGVATLGLVGITGGGIAWATTDPSTRAAWATTGGHCAAPYGMVEGKYSPMAAAAGYLGLSRSELIAEMRSGKSLAEVADAQGRDVDGLTVAMVSAIKQSLAVDTDLTASQRVSILAVMSSHVDAMVAGTHMYGVDADDMGGAMMGGAAGSTRGGFGTGMMGR